MGFDMPYYYGYFISILTGKITNIEGEFDHKPKFEQVGLAFCRWFLDKDLLIKHKNWDIQMINKYKKEH